MIKFTLAIASLTCFSFLALAQDPIQATTTSGAEVLLYDDGTWKYKSAVSPDTGNISYDKSSSHTMRVKSDRGPYELWIDPKKWGLDSSGRAGRQLFQHVDGIGYAMMISEAIPVPFESMKYVAMTNARNAAPDAKVLFEEVRAVNGVDVLCLKLEGTLSKMRFKYYGYYFGGEKGNVQVIAYTTSNVFDKYESEFAELLSGFVINDKPNHVVATEGIVRPSSEVVTSNSIESLAMNDGQFKFSFDQDLWQRTKPSSDAAYAFEHRDGIGYAMIIVERIGIPLDSLQEIVMDNFRDVDPEAHLVARETISIDGRDVLKMRVSAKTSGIDLVYQGFYYGGDEGTIQVITYTSKNLIDKHEEDLLAFLTGLTFE